VLLEVIEHEVAQRGGVLLVEWRLKHNIAMRARLLRGRLGWESLLLSESVWIPIRHRGRRHASKGRARRSVRGLRLLPLTWELLLLCARWPGRWRRGHALLCARGYKWSCRSLLLCVLRLLLILQDLSLHLLELRSGC
jgi:hypothetical protein